MDNDFTIFWRFSSLLQLAILLSFFLIGIRPVWAEEIDASEWGTVANHVQIGIGFQGEAQIKTNQPFKVSVRVKNLSTNGPFNFYLPASTVDGYPISFAVTSPSGKDVSPIPPKVELGSGIVVNVQSTQIFKYEAGLSDLCDFYELGTYKIVAKMPLDMSGHEAISNPLYLTVVPGKWEPTNAPPGEL